MLLLFQLPWLKKKKKEKAFLSVTFHRIITYAEARFTHARGKAGAASHPKGGKPAFPPRLSRGAGTRRRQLLLPTARKLWAVVPGAQPPGGSGGGNGDHGPAGRCFPVPRSPAACPLPQVGRGAAAAGGAYAGPWLLSPLPVAALLRWVARETDQTAWGGGRSAAAAAPRRRLAFSLGRAVSEALGGDISLRFFSSTKWRGRLETSPPLTCWGWGGAAAEGRLCASAVGAHPSGRRGGSCPAAPAPPPSIYLRRAPPACRV